MTPQGERPTGTTSSSATVTCPCNNKQQHTRTAYCTFKAVQSTCENCKPTANGRPTKRKRSASEDVRPSKISRISSKTENGLSNGEGFNTRNEIFSVKGSQCMMKRNATENKSTTAIKRVSFKSVNDPSKEEESNIRD